VGGTNPDYEDSVGERVLLLELAIAAALAAAFLLAPFVVVRRTWRTLPHKANSATYFALLGLGFMFFEIALVQRFTLFLGFPTYSLTVTLASLLVFTGVGSLLSGRIRQRPERVVRALAPGIVVLAGFYLAVLPHLTDALLGSSLGVRFLTTFVVLAPLGLCLGAFMPLGLRTVAELTEGEPAHQYVAWSWAVNGFASVIGSVLTTIVAMSYGFDVVLVLAAIVYLLALAALWRLRRSVPRITLP
jgi:MFS family permease